MRVSSTERMERATRRLPSAVRTASPGSSPVLAALICASFGQASNWRECGFSLIAARRHSVVGCIWGPAVNRLGDRASTRVPGRPRQARRAASTNSVAGSDIAKPGPDDNEGNRHPSRGEVELRDQQPPGPVPVRRAGATGTCFSGAEPHLDSRPRSAAECTCAGGTASRLSPSLRDLFADHASGFEPDHHPEGLFDLPCVAP